MRCIGSSPRGWGMRAGLMKKSPSVRFIPTWVGNALGAWLRVRRRTVHPHVGGECSEAWDRKTVAFGSSPRGWGMLVTGTIPADTSRFIPTWVGNAHKPFGLYQAVAVHPHVGGECVIQCHLQSACPGSSPRGWGMLWFMVCSLVIVRFIPTWVGNAASTEEHSATLTVHPHVGGECPYG